MKRIKREDSVLVAIDFQEKLMPAMYDPKKLEDKMVRLGEGLKALKIPHIVTQQYTKGLGETIPAVAQAIGDFTPIDKVTFSACGNQEFLEALKDMGRKNIILTGIETHICVEQTALDLLEMGYQVFLVADCVQSRAEENYRISLQRLTAAGVVVTSYESVLYELLGSAKASEFKQISSVVK
ncbi:MAG: hydrolase [Firmicutes bacterium]|nr:hydrolase [Bacillota bacterium]